jgi:hypothetical protein
MFDKILHCGYGKDEAGVGVDVHYDHAGGAWSQPKAILAAVHPSDLRHSAVDFRFFVFLISSFVRLEIAIGTPFLDGFRSIQRDQREYGHHRSHEGDMGHGGTAAVSGRTTMNISTLWPV